MQKRTKQKMKATKKRKAETVEPVQGKVSTPQEVVLVNPPFNFFLMVFGENKKQQTKLKDKTK